jgi:hypothetical protein
MLKFPRRPKPLRPFDPTGRPGGSSLTSSHLMPSLVSRCAVGDVSLVLSGRGNEAPRCHLNFLHQNVTALPPLSPFQLKTIGVHLHYAGDHLLSPPSPLQAYKTHLHLTIPHGITLCHSTSPLLAPSELSSDGFAATFVSPPPAHLRHHITSCRPW